MQREEATPTSLELLRLAQAGDRSALDGLVGRYGPRVLGRIRLMLGEEARRQAESVDFLQGVLMATARRIGELELEDERALLRWMTAVARNEIRMAVRAPRARAFAALSSTFAGAGVTDERSPTPDSLAVRREEELRLVEVLEQLDEDHRRAIELRNLEGLAFREVGRRMERSEEAARKLHVRALRGLVARMRAGE